VSQFYHLSDISRNYIACLVNFFLFLYCKKGRFFKTSGSLSPFFCNSLNTSYQEDFTRTGLSCIYKIILNKFCKESIINTAVIALIEISIFVRI